MNNVMLVGRLYEQPELIENLENDKKECIIILAINRYYKNEEGIYETDLIPCSLQGNIAKHIVEYCHKGDTIGVKGSLINTDKLYVNVEKVTFLSSSRGEK